ncbi:MAG: hypothetical protein LQ340_007852 [Diploschistes diacapsis]|nr:MAG: hypothetical protein LQ340_007852 [Diploschistes diacapsis]
MRLPTFFHYAPFLVSLMLLLATPTLSAPAIPWDPYNHQNCLLARPSRPVNESFFSNAWTENLRKCWNLYNDSGWKASECGDRTWYSDSLHWDNPGHCHNACKPCINAALDSGADAAVCYREAGLRGGAACQMGYSPKKPDELVTGSYVDLCDAVTFPNRCWLRDTYSAWSNLAQPQDATWKNNTWLSKYEFVDVQEPLDRIRKEKASKNKDEWCQNGGCMRDAGGKEAWAHGDGPKLSVWPHWGDASTPDTRPHTGGKPPRGVCPNGPPTYKKDRGWYGKRWPQAKQNSVDIHYAD